MKYSSKTELIHAIETEHRILVDSIDGIPRERHKEEGVWGDDWTVHDLLAHLTVWEKMFVRWYRDGKTGDSPALPAPGYKWNETPRLNQAIQKEHARRGQAIVRKEFDDSYEKILTLAKRMTEVELFERGHYPWTKKNHVATYLGANTASHYRTASKILRRWLRGTR